jgi:hypothetical protein
VMRRPASQRDLILCDPIRDSVFAATTTVADRTARDCTLARQHAVGMLSTAGKDDVSVLPAGERALMHKLVARLANAQ